MKSTLIKITPEGLDPEYMVVTTGSSAHESMMEYAKINAYPIEERPCANRFACILQDLERIRTTIAIHCPIIMKQPALGTDCKPFNDALSQCFTNIEVACDEEDDEVEHAWGENLPTFGEYTKNMSLEQMMEMYYEEDIHEAGDSDLPRKVWTYKDVAHAVDNADWLPDFEKKFKEYLREREYIRDDS